MKVLQVFWKFLVQKCNQRLIKDVTELAMLIVASSWRDLVS